MEKATFGAGCFWGVESVFAALPGVTETAVGYAGGANSNPTYEQVCSERTGHAEVVEVTFDPAVIPYQILLDKFFALHDPTQLNRQGPDVGSQYRSVVFYHNAAQEKAAKETINRLQQAGNHKKPIVTLVEAAPLFWRAEDYHQKYFAKRGGGSCHI